MHYLDGGVGRARGGDSVDGRERHGPDRALVALEGRDGLRADAPVGLLGGRELGGEWGRSELGWCEWGGVNGVV